jgi:hypothetical protein
MLGTLELKYLPEKRMVKARLHTDIGVCSGHAHCHPDDIFNQKVGSEIAAARAEIKYITQKKNLLKKQYDQALTESMLALNRASILAEENNALADRYYEVRNQIDTDAQL